MTTERRFEQELPERLAELYLAPAPLYRDDVVARTSRMRQRPAWTFPERWLPMSVVTRRPTLAAGVPWRALGVLALIGLLLAATLAAYIGTRHRVPAPFGPARNGEIVFAKDADIYVRDDIAAAPRLIVGGSTDDEAPTFSRAGDRYMFLRLLESAGSATDSTPTDIMTARADGSDVRRLAGPYPLPSHWDWSPTGSSIVIGYDRVLPASAQAVHTVTVIPADGSAPVTWDLPVDAEAPVWRPPNGDQLAFRALDSARTPTMFLIRPDGTGLTPIDLPRPGLRSSDEDFTAGGTPGSPFNHGYAWSPNGQQLAYAVIEPIAGSNDGGLRLHVADIDPAGRVLADRKREFDPAAGDEWDPVWSPDGTQLVFVTRSDGVDSLAVGPADGSGPATYMGTKSTGGSGIGVEIAPDGRSVLALFWNEQTTWRYDLDTGQASSAGLGPIDVASFQRLAP